MKEVAFLKQIVRQIQARRILEIGTFDGTSALAMAECLPDDGELITCEINAGLAALARKRAGRHPHGHKVDVRPGPALKTLPHLTGYFDLIFIDADTQNYVEYFHTAMRLLKPAGMLLMDNMKAAEFAFTIEVPRQTPLPPAPAYPGAATPTPFAGPGHDKSGAAILALTHELASNSTLDSTLARVRDGVMVITAKRPHSDRSEVLYK